MEEVVWSRTTKDIVVAERDRVSIVLGVIGTLELVAQAEVDGDVRPESPLILGECTPGPLLGTFSQVALQGVVETLIGHRRPADCRHATNEGSVDGPSFRELGSVRSREVGRRCAAREDRGING